MVLVGLTIFQMVLGELMPKSLALQRPTRVALWTVLPMHWSLRALAWFIDALNGSGRAILRLLRVPESGHRHVHSAQEIAYLVTESGKGGLLKPGEQLRLRQALHLGRRPPRELMVPRTAVVALDADTPMAEVARVAMESPYTRFPVYEGTIDRVIGVVHARDVASRGRDRRGRGRRRAARDAPPLRVAPATRSADRLLVRMKEERRTMAVLVDEYGGTAGLITIDNILDDLIGDIADEFRPRPPVPSGSPTGVSPPGRAPGGRRGRVDARAVGARAATVGGLVTTCLGRMPEAGDRVTIEGVVVRWSAWSGAPCGACSPRRCAARAAERGARRHRSTPPSDADRRRAHPPQRAVRRRGVRDRRAPRPPSSGAPPRATGARASGRAHSRRREGAGPLHRHRAARDHARRASASACTASTCSPSGSPACSRGGGPGAGSPRTPLGSVIAIAILTYFHIVVGEMVPKSLALQRAERTVLWIAPVMRRCSWVSFPLIVMLNGLGPGDREHHHLGSTPSNDQHLRVPRHLAAGPLLGHRAWRQPRGVRTPRGPHRGHLHRRPAVPGQEASKSFSSTGSAIGGAN